MSEEDEDYTLIDQVPRTLRSEVRVPVGGQDAIRTPTLTVVTGPSPGRYQAISLGTRAIFIGRDATCEFAVDHSSVSRRHARLYIERQGHGAPIVVLQDLESTNGTLVNNRPIHRQTLSHGDRVRIGDVLLRFEMLDKLDIAYRDGVAQQIEESELDVLTRLLNRSAMGNHLPQLIEHCVSVEIPVSAVLLDLDHFKQINDNLGHAAGDTVLRKIGEIIRQTIRKDDLAIRYGGEEFLLVLPGARRLHARLQAERLRESIAAAEFEGQSGLQVTASLGVSEWEQSESLDLWIDRTDRALYRAKERGRNRSEAAPPPSSGAS